MGLFDKKDVPPQQQPQVSVEPPERPDNLVVKSWGFDGMFYDSSRTGLDHGRGPVAFDNIAFVYEIVGNISRAAAELPLKVFEIDPETKERTESLTHPAYKTLRAPYPGKSRALWVSECVMDLCLQGNAFWGLFTTPSGRITFERLRPERMRYVLGQDNELIAWDHTYGGGDSNTTRLELNQVLHIKMPNPGNDYIGASPISALRYDLQMGTNARDTVIDLGQNRGIIPTIAYVDDALEDDDLDRIEQQMRNARRVGQKGKTPVIPKSINIEQLALNPVDAKWLETTDASRAQVAAAFRYPLPENYQGQSPDSLRKALFMDAVYPYLIFIEESLEILIDEMWPTQPAFPQFQLSHVLDGDLPVMLSALKDGVYAGIVPPEWARQKLDIPEGKYDTFIPLNMNRILPDGTVDVSPRVTETGPIPPAQDVADDGSGGGGGTPQNDSTGGMGGDQGQGQGGTGNGNAKMWDPSRKECESCGSKDLAAGMCLHCPVPDEMREELDEIARRLNESKHKRFEEGQVDGLIRRLSGLVGDPANRDKVRETITEFQAQVARKSHSGVPQEAMDRLADQALGNLETENLKEIATAIVAHAIGDYDGQS